MEKRTVCIRMDTKSDRDNLVAALVEEGYTVSQKREYEGYTMASRSHYYIIVHDVEVVDEG